MHRRVATSRAGTGRRLSATFREILFFAEGCAYDGLRRNPSDILGQAAAQQPTMADRYGATWPVVIRS